MKIVTLLFSILLFTTLTFAADEEKFVEFKAKKIRASSENLYALDLIEKYRLSPKSEEMLLNAVVNLLDVPQSKVSGSELMRVLNSVFKDIEASEGQKIKVRIPASLEIINPFGGSTSSLMRSKLKNQIEALCEGCRIEFAEFKAQMVPTQEENFDFLVNQLPRGTFSIPLIIRSGKGDVRSWVTGQTRIMRLVPIASRSISSDQAIRAEDSKLEWRDMTFSREVPLAKEKLGNVQAKRNFRPGDLLTDATVLKLQIIKRGQPLKAQVKNGDLELTMDALAQENGGLNDNIRIKIPSTNKVTTGKVINDGLVELR